MPEADLTITLHVACSLDGYIARADNSVSWLETPPDAYPDGEAMDSPEVMALVSAIDAYVLGARTYEHALELGWPYGDTPVFVVTSRNLPKERDTVSFHSGDLGALVADVLAPRFDNVWLGGGAMLCQSFLEQDLVDEIRLAVAPVLLGGGLRLFGEATEERRWRLRDAVAFRTGFVELVYGRDGSRGEP